MREVLVDTVSRTGGHLGANLGAVELTLALMRSLDLDRDEIVWDVGHQCYVHKMLTGRYDRLPTLRQHGGLAGFPKRAESPFDHFDTGHSATSISAALGKALARDLRGEDRRMVAVIGDGAMTGGLALEAINHAGRTHTSLLVVLNDNAMSIADNVGAFSRYLDRIRMEPYYKSSKEYAKEILQNIPKVGKLLYRLVHKMEDSLKYLVVPGVVFEELGFTYLGPVDGHDLPLLEETFELALHHHPKPVLMHVKTTKGKGYEPAERNQPAFHGTGPFEVSTGKSTKKGGAPSYTSVFGKTLCELAATDDRIIAITAAMLHGTGLEDFSRLHPDRFFDVGIAEQHAVTFAAGLATEGFRPVVAIYSTFLQRAFDQVLHDVCLQGLPVIFALDRAGLVGEDGPTHHGAFDLSFLRCIPGLTLLAPRHEGELARMLRSAVELDGPVAIRYPRGAGFGVEPAAMEGTLEALVPERLREGTGPLFVGVGPICAVLEEAAERLAAEGRSIEVLDGRVIKPLAGDWLDALAASGPPRGHGGRERRGGRFRHGGSRGPRRSGRAQPRPSPRSARRMGRARRRGDPPSFLRTRPRAHARAPSSLARPGSRARGPTARPDPRARALEDPVAGGRRSARGAATIPRGTGTICPEGS